MLTGSKLTRATPNFSGLSLRRAMELARVSRVNVDVHGGGYVVAQEPARGRSAQSCDGEADSALAIVADSGAETAADAGVVPASYFSGGGVSPVRRK